LAIEGQSKQRYVLPGQDDICNKDAVVRDRIELSTFRFSGRAAFRAVRQPSSLASASLADADPPAGHIQGTWNRELARNDKNERDIISQVGP
jgi:hypothetical protein